MALLEGLEVSVFSLKKVREENKHFRLDDDYFRKKFIKNDLNLIKKEFSRLSNLTTLITDFGAFSQMNFVKYRDSGIPFIRNQNVQDNEIDLNDTVYVDKETYNKLSLKLEENDILIPRAGTLGNAAVISKEILPATANQNVAQIKPDLEKIEPYLLSTFLCSKYGLNQIERMSTGNVQQWLNLENINNIKIPLFKIKFQIEIKNIILKAKLNKYKSKQTYAQAEKLLLVEIGLQDFKASSEAVNIKSFQDSFATSGRLDAEFYQKKYEQIIEKVKKKPFDNLNKIVDIKKSIEPGTKNYADEGMPFMRVADISKQGLSPPQKFISYGFVHTNYEQVQNLKPKKGTILFSKDGSVGIAYHLRENYAGITSSALLHLTIKDKSKVLPEYLTLVLNSEVVQKQAERDSGGSIIKHWRVSEIKSVIVPIIDQSKQQQIADLIEQSFALKKRSEHLLAVAKRAVEIAIEQNEAEAMEYIRADTKEDL